MYHLLDLLDRSATGEPTAVGDGNFAMAMATRRLVKKHGLNMNQQGSGRNLRTLWVLILLAAIYGGLLYFRHGVTGRPLLDGFIGVALGLYICSRPAANAVDLLFAERYRLRLITGGWAGLGWLALNLLVFSVGFAVIVLGTRQLAAAAI